MTRLVSVLQHAGARVRSNDHQSTQPAHLKQPTVNILFLHKNAMIFMGFKDYNSEYSSFHTLLKYLKHARNPEYVMLLGSEISL